MNDSFSELILPRGYLFIRPPGSLMAKLYYWNAEPRECIGTYPITVSQGEINDAVNLYRESLKQKEGRL